MKNLITFWTIAVVTTAGVQAGVKNNKPISGHQLQANFNRALESGDTKQVMQMMHPQLRSQIDQPVLHRWQQQMQAKLGRVRSIKQTLVNATTENNAHKLTTTATITCEKGELTVELRALNGKVVGFDLISEKLVNWLDKPATTKLYEQRAMKFVREMLTGDTKQAYGMLHSALRETISKQDYEVICEHCRAKIDASKAMKLSVKNSRMLKIAEGKAPTLMIDVRIQNGELDETCEMKFQFVGMQGHILGFFFQK